MWIINWDRIRKWFTYKSCSCDSRWKAPDGVVYGFFAVGCPNYSLELALAMHGIGLWDSIYTSCFQYGFTEDSRWLWFYFAWMTMTLRCMVWWTWSFRLDCPDYRYGISYALVGMWDLVCRSFVFSTCLQRTMTTLLVDTPLPWWPWFVQGVSCFFLWSLSLAVPVFPAFDLPVCHFWAAGVASDVSLTICYKLRHENWMPS